MYINSVYYKIDLNIYHSLREFMLYNVYNHIEYINEIMNLISSKIDVIDISFDSMRFEININIRKTTLKKAKGHNEYYVYYYTIMNDVFKDFFERHPEIVNAIERTTSINLNSFNSNQFDNICQIYCIGDKTVSIKL